MEPQRDPLAAALECPVAATAVMDHVRCAQPLYAQMPLDVHDAPGLCGLGMVALFFAVSLDWLLFAWGVFVYCKRFAEELELEPKAMKDAKHEDQKLESLNRPA